MIHELLTIELKENMSTATIIQNETFNNLLAELQLEDYQPSANAQALINAEARYIKDLKINTGNVKKVDQGGLQK